MQILKFGGSSVASAPCIQQVKSIIEAIKGPFLIVTSAFQGATDQLIEIAQKAVNHQHLPHLKAFEQRHIEIGQSLIPHANQAEIVLFIQRQCQQIHQLCAAVSTLNELSDRSKAAIIQHGELLSSMILYRCCLDSGLNVNYLDSREFIKTKGAYLQGIVLQEQTNKRIQQIDYKQSYIVPGFIASNQEGHPSLLGRGGSDYSAAIFAAALKANQLELWSDVHGMLSADPSIVPEASTIQNLSYKEAFELAHFGAKVVYPPTIRPLMTRQIPVYLKNTFDPTHPGSYIGPNIDNHTKALAKGVSSISNISLLSVAGIGLAGQKGMASRVFGCMEAAEINIILISQCCSEQSICIGIADKDASKASEALNNHFRYEIQQQWMDAIAYQSQYAVIALVGDGMKSSIGWSGKVFAALGENGINIAAIAQGASERNISLVVDQKNRQKAINILHERFFDNSHRCLHIFIAGIGNVGQQFVDLVYKQQNSLAKDLQLKIKIVGIANSKKMLFESSGIDALNALELDKKGVVYQDFRDYIQQVKDLNLQNSIFIDNTASSLVSEYYQDFLEASISVVVCNKIACSGPFDKYQLLKQTAQRKQCQFLYETTVAAALPVIKTIQDLVLSGDTITQIKAVLSGSLNFIFNHYDATESFAKVVERAAEAGFTEPNPLIDLSGVDVMRKILILAREANYPLEMASIECDSFLPQECLASRNKNQLMELLQKNESHFKKLYQSAVRQNCRLKFVATFKDATAKVGLELIPPESPMYHLAGKDNIVSIHSLRYPSEPLVIKGAGAGAALTASGVFSDLMLLFHQSAHYGSIH